MFDIFRDAPIGRLLRLAGGKRLFSYPEDSDSFELPKAFTQDNAQRRNHDDLGKARKPVTPDQASSLTLEEGGSSDTTACTKDSNTSPDFLESEYQEKKAFIVIGWYSDDDTENPKNWSAVKKTYVSLLLLIYVFTVYIGSSIYTASIPGIVDTYNVSEVAAAVGLAVYILGYGVGPLLWSPVSEIPAIGRSPPYAISFFMFVMVCIPSTIIDSFGGLLVLRFFMGFFGAPALATAGASLGDFFEPNILPYMILSWTGGASMAPALGPLVGGFAVQAKGWRWSFYELLWLSVPVLVIMLLFLPETSSNAILYQRAKRLRAITGRDDIVTAGEIKQARMHARQVAFDALIKPWEINLRDPAVLFTTVYTGLIYGIYYTFFESFPLVYQSIYGFDLSQLGLAFLSTLIGVVITSMGFIAYQYFFAGPKQAAMEKIPPEELLRPGLFATFCIPIGLFIFAWTSRTSVHWSASMVGAMIAQGGIVAVSTCLLNYLPFTYPQYAGSLFAANGLARSATAAGSVLYGRPMFINLTIQGGVSLLAGLTVLCSVGFYVLFIFGPALRKRSRFAID